MDDMECHRLDKQRRWICVICELDKYEKIKFWIKGNVLYGQMPNVGESPALFVGIVIDYCTAAVSSSSSSSNYNKYFYFFLHKK